VKASVNVSCERDLIDRLRVGEPAAFEQVYEAEKSSVYGFLLRLCRDAHVAADLFQNVWLKLAKSAPRLREDSNLRAWLLTVARREYISFRRAQALDISRVLLLDLGQSAAAGEPEADLALAAALGRLADADRELLLLAASGLEPEAIAGTLGISGAAFRQRLSRARRRLAVTLAEVDIPGDQTVPKGAR
jgi:RNA polymerase sigma-70 factor, ECF subfamily